MMKRIAALFSCVLMLCSCKGAEPGGEPTTPPSGSGLTMPRKEIRGIWVATVDCMDWPRSYNKEAQKKEYVEYLDLFKQYNANAVIMQVRPMADAFYDSEFEPWSQYITGVQGKNPGYDVLRFMIDETHKHGLEFHAWMNPYRISNNVNTFRPAENHIYKKHPEWTMTYGKLLIFRPALPEVREHLVNVIDELMTKYPDIDGIHFDDYFYPYPAGVELEDQGDFLKYGQEYETIEDFRRGNVNKVIEDIHNLLVEKYPGVVFSISPYGVWRNKKDDPNGSDSNSLSNYDDLYADIRLWCEKGWIDLVVPQLYASTENINMNFTKMTSWWAKNSFDCPVAIGHGLYKFGNPNEGAIFMNPLELETQFFYARRNKDIQGSFLFNATVFKANKINILDNLGKIYAERTLIPFMGRESCQRPERAANVKVSGKTISWTAQDGMRYVVYKVTDNKAAIADIVSENSFVCPESGSYAVSVLNGDNTESALTEIMQVN